MTLSPEAKDHIRGAVEAFAKTDPHEFTPLSEDKICAYADLLGDDDLQVEHTDIAYFLLTILAHAEQEPPKC